LRCFLFFFLNGGRSYFGFVVYASCDHTRSVLGVIILQTLVEIVDRPNNVYRVVWLGLNMPICPPLRSFRAI